MVKAERKEILIAARERGPGPGRYALPSTVGEKNHDFSKHKKPAYSMGMRLDNDKYSKNTSPGPKYGIDPRVTRSGNEGAPKYTISGRNNDLDIFKSPGPGTYDNHKVHPQGQRRAPAYSMSQRTKYRKEDSVPAANAYNVPHLIGPKLANKKSNPSYSMTARTNVNSFSEDLAKTPGPAKYGRTSNNLVKNKQPAYSMQGRNQMPGDETRKPGPGAHYPERVTIHKKRAPGFSMGIRHSEFIAPLIIDADL